MAIYEVETDDGIYEVDVDEGEEVSTQPAEPQRELQGPLDTLGGGLSSIFNGTALNSGDEIVGSLAAPITYGAGLINRYLNDAPAISYEQATDNSIAASRNLRTRFGDENPIASTAFEVAGSLRNPFQYADKLSKIKKLGRIGKAAALSTEGALQMGAYGYGEEGGEGRVANALDSLGTGGAYGGALGVGFGGVSRVADSVISGLKDVGRRFKTSAIGITATDIKNARAGGKKGAANPLLDAFDSLDEQGAFAGDKSPAVLGRKLEGQRADIEDELGLVLDAGNGATPAAIPNFTSTRKFIDAKKVDRAEAEKIYQEEVQGLMDTLDNGGTLDDWQKAKVDMQNATVYNRDTPALKQEIRQKIASDLRQHIEDQVDHLPGLKGQVKKLNHDLRERHLIEKPLRRGENAADAQDPERKLKMTWATTGGYGVPIALATTAAGSEYGRSGSLSGALAAGATGAFLGSRTGKFGIGRTLNGAGNAIRGVQSAIPEASTMLRAGVPLFVKETLESERQQAEIEQAQASPITYFKGGAQGIRQYKATLGDSDTALEPIYKDATEDYRNYVAPSGKVDPAKLKTWVDNNAETLAELPELKAQLTNPMAAQQLIDKHFKDGQPLSRPEIENNSFMQLTNLPAEKAVEAMLSGDGSLSKAKQLVGFVGKDKDALAGLQRATLSAYQAIPEGMKKALTEDRAVLSQIFNQDQIKNLEGMAADAPLAPGESKTVLKELKDTLSNKFLKTSGSGYLAQVEPALKGLDPAQARQLISDSIYDPKLSRILNSKSTPQNTLAAARAIFGGVLPELNPPPPPPAPKPVAVPQKEKITANSFAPDPKKVLNPGTGKLKVSQLLEGEEPMVKAIAEAESNWNPNAVSGAGAQGLMQLMPANQKVFKVSNPFDPSESLRAGKALLAEERNRFRNEKLAAYAYNAGSPRVMQAIRAAGSRNPDKVAQFLPKETRNYGDKVMSLVDKYAKA